MGAYGGMDFISWTIASFTACSMACRSIRTRLRRCRMVVHRVADRSVARTQQYAGRRARFHARRLGTRWMGSVMPWHSKYRL